MAMTVTATQGGSTATGLVLRVYVVTGAAVVASQSGGSFNNQFTGTTTWTGSITTTAGSNVYGGAAGSNSGPVLTGSNATVVDNVPDTGNVESYISFKALNVTTGATTRGFTSTAAMGGPLAMLEILASGTLAEDASAPPAASTTTAITIVTASFTPPGGSLLVAIVGSDGGAGITTMTVSGGGLTWTEKVKNNPSAGDYAGVWIADVAGGAGVSGKAPPGARMVYPRSGTQIHRAATARSSAIAGGQPGGANAPAPPVGVPVAMMLGRPSRLAETYRLVT